MAQPADLVFTDPILTNAYVQYRPVPPPTLSMAVVDYVKQTRGEELGVCGDIGCGSGQNTGLYSDYFREVVGVDVSAQQLAIARTETQHLPNVTYREGLAEKLPFSDASVDLLTCSAAVHWFDVTFFYAEVERVLRPGGVLACYNYVDCIPLYNGKSFYKQIKEMNDTLEPYWTAGHNTLLDEYATLPKLYEDDVLIRTNEGRFTVETDATLDTILGYISSWSAYGKFSQAQGKEAAASFINNCKQKLLKEMGTQDETVPMRRRFEYFLRMFRKPTAL